MIFYTVLFCNVLSKVRSVHRAIKHRIEEAAMHRRERAEQVGMAVGLGVLVAGAAVVVAKSLGRRR